MLVYGEFITTIRLSIYNYIISPRNVSAKRNWKMRIQNVDFKMKKADEEIIMKEYYCSVSILKKDIKQNFPNKNY
jgi:hypothetical protein